MADGSAYTLPPVHLPISGVATVNVNAALAAAPPDDMRSVSSFGSASLRHTYGTRGRVLGSVEVLDIARSLVFSRPGSQAIPRLQIQQQAGLRGLLEPPLSMIFPLPIQ
jgi:hypothetical protein